MSDTRNTNVVISISPASINKSLDLIKAETVKHGTQLEILDRYFAFNDDGTFSFKDSAAENEFQRGYGLVVNNKYTRANTSAAFSHSLKYAGLDPQLGAFATLLILQNSQADLTHHGFVLATSEKIDITTKSTQITLQPEVKNFIEVRYSENNEPVILVGIKRTTGVIQDLEKGLTPPTIIIDEIELFEVKRNSTDANNPFTLVPFQNVLILPVNIKDFSDDEIDTLKKVFELAGTDGNITFDGDFKNIDDANKLFNLLNRLLKTPGDINIKLLSHSIDTLINDIESQTSRATEEAVRDARKAKENAYENDLAAAKGYSGQSIQADPDRNSPDYQLSQAEEDNIRQSFKHTKEANGLVQSQHFIELKNSLKQLREKTKKETHEPNFFERNRGAILGFIAIAVVTILVITACVFIPPVGAALATGAASVAAIVGASVASTTATAVAGVGILGGLAAIGLSIGLGIKALVSKIKNNITVEDVKPSEKETYRVKGVNTADMTADMRKNPKAAKKTSKDSLIIIESDEEHTASTSSSKSREESRRVQEDPNFYDFTDKKNRGKRS